MERKLVYRDEYMRQLRSFRDVPVVKIVTGIRRCGKSTLLAMFRDELLDGGVAEDRIVYVNFESMAFDGIREYGQLYDYVSPLIVPGGKCYLFFDEIQQVSGWERAVNAFVADFDADVYITGSNSYLLSSEFATFLSGRYVEIKLLPLSFKEYYGFWRDGADADVLFDRYLRYGGMPGLTAVDPGDGKAVDMYLSGLSDSIVLKDIINRSSFKDDGLIRRVFAFLCANQGSIVSANGICDYIVKQARLYPSLRPAAVLDVLNALEKAFLVYRVDRYDVRSKELLKSLEKYYVTDTGLKNVYSGYALKNRGYAVEGIVYFELIRRGYKVYVGRTGRGEVDFVASKGEDTKYIQVTETLAGEATREREFAPFSAVPGFYDRVVITSDRDVRGDADGIKVVNTLDFLLE